MKFPILNERINGHQLIYFDNAATAQKPQEVIDKIKEYYEKTNSNVHRGIHTLSEKATKEYEQARVKVAQFINAEPQEIIFTKGTTESLNILATILPLKKDDEILLTEMEHHANIVPWQNTGAKIRYIPITKEGELNLKEYKRLLNKKTKVVSLTHLSNVLGTINNVKQIIQEAKKYKAITIIDGAQAIAHLKIDVKKIDCDFYAFSGHKMYGPTGIGILFGKQELLNKLPPYQFGGEMVLEVTKEKATYNEIPWKFEAGTPNIAGAIGLKEAINFIEKEIKPEQEITEYAYEQLTKIQGLKILGPKKRGPLISFTLENCHPHDIAALLNEKGIAVRAGHHCAMPLANVLGITASTRISFAIYNTKKEIDICVKELKRIKEILTCQ